MPDPPPEGLVLRYPVHALDGETLLPAGVRLTPGLLAEVADRGRRKKEPSHRLLQHGTVLPDMAACICEGPYQVIFSDCKRFQALMETMQKVSLPDPLLRTLDFFKAHDPFTYRHVLCVFALSTLLAQDLAGTQGDAIPGATSGPLHDFGKTCVPLSVMRKRTPLTRAERDLLRHHTLAGCVLLAWHFGDPDALSAKVALEHHERRDGSGYPRGILLDDRMVEIVAVCDVYDALISSRPYRPSCYDNRTAIEEMTALVEAGRLDREVVQVLVAYNRRNRPDPRACELSLEKRGMPPAGNVYGLTADDLDLPPRESDDPAQPPD
jgi:HD-GYP domain-containing protein (c-di-GMP phosphodiesterase class II)